MRDVFCLVAHSNGPASGIPGPNGSVLEVAPAIFECQLTVQAVGSWQRNQIDSRKLRADQRAGTFKEPYSRRGL